MKKAAAGCIFSILLIVVAIGVGAYFFLYKPGKALYDAAQQAVVIAELNEEIRDQSTYRPTDERLTEDQVARFVQVQRSILHRMGDELRYLEQQYETFNRELQAQDRDARLREMLEAWRDVVGLLVSAKRAQVEALNETGFSLSEYEWVRQQVLSALGYGMFGLSVEAFMQDPSDPAVQTVPAPASEAREHNQTLIEPHRDDLEEALAVLFFGL